MAVGGLRREVATGEKGIRMAVPVVASLGDESVTFACGGIGKHLFVK
jgi:hypothetical protein